MQNTTKHLHRYWPLLLAIALSALPMIAFAAEGTTQNDAITKTFEFLSVVLTGMQAVLWPVLMLMGGLLNNDLLFSGGMLTILLNIWTAVRDFVNVLFVLGLLLLAIANILGLGKGDDFSIQKVLPLIAVALIGVNFSFLACKVILDVVNVTSTAIYAVPLASSSLKQYEKDGSPAVDNLSKRFCQKIMSIPKADAESMKGLCEKDGTATAAAQKDKKDAPIVMKLSDEGRKFFSRFNSRNVALVMAMELMSIANIDSVDAKQIKDLTATEAIKGLAVQTIFSIIFLVIYASSFIALFCVLLVRLVVLWITIVTMPITFIGFPFKAGYSKRVGENDPWQLFFKHAIIPVPVALVLTIGMIMISQLKQITPGMQYSTSPSSLGALTASASTLQDLIAGFATAAFIWTAAFTAMKGTKGDFLVNKVHDTVSNAGKSLAKMPLYMPIIPTSKGMVGLAALGGGGLTSGLEKFYNDQNSKWRETPEASAKAQLDKATKDNAGEIIAKIVRDANNRPSAETQKDILATIEKFPDLKKKIVGAGRFTGHPEKFLDELKAGNITESDWQDFNKANAKTFKPPEANQEHVNKTVTAAVGKAKTAGVGAKVENGKIVMDGSKSGIEDLDKAVSDLQKATEAFEKESDPKKKLELQEKIDNISASIEKMANAKDKVGSDFKADSIVDASGKIINGKGAESLQSGYGKVEGSEQGHIKEMLINKFAEKMGGNRAKAESVVNEILEKGKDAKGIVPDAPEAPKVPEPPKPGDTPKK